MTGVEPAYQPSAGAVAGVLRWVLGWLRPPFDVVSCTGTYWDDKGPRHDQLLIKYELQLVNRRLEPNSIREIHFRFRNREGGAPDQVLPDLQFRGHNVPPRGSVHLEGELQLHESLRDTYGIGDARLLGGDVLLDPTQGRRVKGPFCFLSREFQLRFGGGGEART